MKTPDYREAACCLNCTHVTTMSLRCTKHGDKVDMEYVCADFYSRKKADGGDA